VKKVYNGLRRFVLFAFFLISITLLGGCDLNTRMSTFDTKGPVAEKQLELFMVTFWVTMGIFIVVGGTLLLVVLKFRERKNDSRPMPAQGHGNPLVEISLIGASVLLLVIIAVPTLRTIWFMYDPPVQERSVLGEWYKGDNLANEEAGNSLTIRVVGFQWWWAFEYPQLGVTTANEMIIPAGKAIHMQFRSVDVIHSFWLPQIAGKVDLIPGRANHMWIQAGDTFEDWKARNGKTGGDAELRKAYLDYLRDEIYGYYYGQCAEYCGDSHARMLFRCSVVSDEDFTKWVADYRAGHSAPGEMDWAQWYQLYDNNPEQLTGEVNEGLKLFMGRARCATCHTVNGNPRAVGVAGPNLTRVASRRSIAAGWLNHRADDGSVDVEKQYANFYKWITETNVVKPGNRMWKAYGGGIGELPEPLSSEEARKIVLYLQTLK